MSMPRQVLPLTLLLYAENVILSPWALSGAGLRDQFAPMVIL